MIQTLHIITYLLHKIPFFSPRCQLNQSNLKFLQMQQTLQVKDSRGGQRKGSPLRQVIINRPLEGPCHVLAERILIPDLRGGRTSVCGWGCFSKSLLPPTFHPESINHVINSCSDFQPPITVFTICLAHCFRFITLLPTGRRFWGADSHPLKHPVSFTATTNRRGVPEVRGRRTEWSVGL